MTGTIKDSHLRNKINKLLYDAYSTLYLLTNHKMARHVSRNIRNTPHNTPTVMPIRPSLQMVPEGGWVTGSEGVVVERVVLKSHTLLGVVLVVRFFCMFPPGNFVVGTATGVVGLDESVVGDRLAGLSKKYKVFKNYNE